MTRLAAYVAGGLIGVASLGIAVNWASTEPEALRRIERTATQSVASEPDALVGEAYAKDLGLPVIPDPSACKYAAEAPPDDTLYCLDGVADDRREAKLIGMRVNGEIPTDIDIRILDLHEELDALPDTPENEAQRIELLLEIGDLMAAR